jgi:hypothetical protein
LNLSVFFPLHFLLSHQVWSDQGAGQLSNFETGKMGFFSVYGHRTPHLEGRPGMQSKLMNDIRTKVRVE